MKPLLALIVLMFAAALPLAADAAKHAPIDLAAFERDRERIRADLAKGEVYSELSAQQRRDVLEALDRMSSTLEGVTSTDQIPLEDRTRLFNDQELVNTVLTKAAEDSRLVCTHERTTGSHRRSTHCRTVAERRRLREASERDLQTTRRSSLRAPRE